MALILLIYGKETCSFSLALHDFPSANTILSNDNSSVFIIKAPFSPFLPLFSSPRRQFPPSPSAPKIPSWQIPVKPSSPSNPVVANHNSSSDISPVSNESTTSSPVKENHSPEGSKVSCHLLSTEEGTKAVIDVTSQVRMEVQGEEEKKETKRNDEEEEDNKDDDVSHVDEEECLGVQTEDRRGGDGQINEQVEKLRRPEGASNENEID